VGAGLPCFPEDFQSALAEATKRAGVGKQRSYMKTHTEAEIES
jgi:hypothetical protein